MAGQDSSTSRRRQREITGTLESLTSGRNSRRQEMHCEPRRSMLCCSVSEDGFSW